MSIMADLFTSLPFFSLILIFIFSSAVVWYAGIYLAKTTEKIDLHLNLSEAFGGLIFLAIVTNLPQIAIIFAASMSNQTGIAVGSILGGIAIQTIVIVILDGFGLGRKVPLSYAASSLQLVLEATLVITMLLISIMATRLPKTLLWVHIAPGDLLLLFTWLIGLWLIHKARRRLPWHEKGRPPNTIQPPQTKRQKRKKWNTPFVFLLFGGASIATLIAGVVCEETGSIIAEHIGWSGVLFGSTVLALVATLPSISSGLEAVKMGDYTLAYSDIFGGNAFALILFLPITLFSGESILPKAQNTDIYLSCLGALLTCIYIYGLIFRPKRQFLFLGMDSVAALFIYIVGMLGFVAMNLH